MVFFLSCTSGLSGLEFIELLEKKLKKNDIHNYFCCEFIEI